MAENPEASSNIYLEVAGVTTCHATMPKPVTQANPASLGNTLLLYGTGSGVTECLPKNNIIHNKDSEGYRMENKQLHRSSVLWQ